jgi:hypothetical protein
VNAIHEEGEKKERKQREERRMKSKKMRKKIAESQIVVGVPQTTPDENVNQSERMCVEIGEYSRGMPISSVLTITLAHELGCVWID